MTAILERTLRTIMLCGVACAAMAGTAALAVETEKPVAGQQVHFARGTWSAVPQLRDGKVGQCVLVSLRPRAGKSGTVDTRLSLNISRGAGFAFSLGDDALPGERVLDDQAEVVLDEGASVPAVGFDVTATYFAFHPGDAAAVLTGLATAKTLRLRSAGAGIDTGAITLDLPPEALAWLIACGKTFDIAVDRPTDPNAPPLPAPRPRSPEIASSQPTAAGPAGIEDKQKISGWDASELRGADGKVAVCMIRRHYFFGAEKGARQVGTFLMASRSKGLIMMLKDSSLTQHGGDKLDATLSFGGKPFTGFTAQMLSADEIGIFPQHGLALAQALGEAERFDFKSKIVGIEFPVQGAVNWLRACVRRNGFGFEAPAP